MNSQPRPGLFAWSQPAVLALGFAVLVAANGASLWLVTRAQSGHEDVVHTLDVENKLSNLLLMLRRTESAQRGYLLTQRDEYLASYREAVKGIAPLFADIDRLTADNEVQRANLAALRPPVLERLNELEAVIAARNSGGIEAAIALMQQGAGQRHLETARQIVERMIGEEMRLLQSRSRDADATIFSLFAVNLAGSLLILALGIAALFLIRQSLKQRDAAQAELSAANIDLEATIAERTSELEEANQELQRYAYIVSHDLRSPLVNIMGFTTELESLRGEIATELAARKRPEGDDTPHDDAEFLRNYDEALGFIKASIGKMDHLIHAILKLSREGQRQFIPESIDLSDLLKSIAATIAHQIDEAGAELAIEPLPQIDSDRIALEQIFSNLLDNAVKYLDPGRPGRIAVTGRRVLSHYVIEVADNGRGIREQDHRRIFDLFRRSGVQDRPGEGIGLAHVRTLVRRLGGRISVKSNAGEGSVFSVTLPMSWQPAMERNAA